MIELQSQNIVHLQYMELFFPNKILLKDFTLLVQV